MKRWLALVTALAVLLAFGAGPAEEEGPTAADLQETLASEGKEGVGTLADNLAFLKDMLEDEDILSLLKISDVQKVTNEIVWRVLAWLYQNRDVTMKVLTELGVSEEDQRCIVKLWDSADRISDAGKAYNESENGKLLLETTHAVLEDPDILESWDNFQAMASSEDISRIVNAIADTAQEGAEAEHPQSGMAAEAVERQLDRSSFIGTMFMTLFDAMEETEWFSSSVPKLIKNENLWRWLILTADSNYEMNLILQKEINLLASDPEMVSFVNRTLQQAFVLMQTLSPAQEETPEENVPTENTADKEETS